MARAEFSAASPAWNCTVDRSGRDVPLGYTVTYPDFLAPVTTDVDQRAGGGGIAEVELRSRDLDDGVGGNGVAVVDHRARVLQVVAHGDGGLGGGHAAEPVGHGQRGRVRARFCVRVRPEGARGVGGGRVAGAAVADALARYLPIGTAGRGLKVGRVRRDSPDLTVDIGRGGERGRGRLSGQREGLEGLADGRAGGVDGADGDVVLAFRRVRVADGVAGERGDRRAAIAEVNRVADGFPPRAGPSRGDRHAERVGSHAGRIASRAERRNRVGDRQRVLRRERASAGVAGAVAEVGVDRLRIELPGIAERVRAELARGGAVGGVDGGRPVRWDTVDLGGQGDVVRPLTGGSGEGGRTGVARRGPRVVVSAGQGVEGVVVGRDPARPNRPSRRRPTAPPRRRRSRSP